MANGINKVILIGRLGADPDVKYTSGGDAITNIRMATSESWKDKAGEKQERTEWHRVVFYRKLAEIAGKYLKKGAMVYIEGRIQTRKWQDQNGADRWTTEIVANEMQMLDSKRDGGGFQPGADSASGGYSPPSGNDSAPAPGASPEYDDDIPF